VDFGFVRSHDGRSTGSRNHGNSGGLRRGRLGKEGRRFHQAFEIVDDYHAGAFECGAIRCIRAGKRAGMRDGRLRTQLASRDLVDEQRLVRPPGELSSLEQPLWMRHPLEHTGNGLAVRILRQVGDQIGDINIALIASREGMAHGGPPLDRLGE
jgi:hypothetical protein